MQFLRAPVTRLSNERRRKCAGECHFDDTIINRTTGHKRKTRRGGSDGNRVTKFGFGDGLSIRLTFEYSRESKSCSNTKNCEFRVEEVCTSSGKMKGTRDEVSPFR